MKTSIFALAASLSIVATTTFAHATLETQETSAEASYKGVMRIGHGCDGDATLVVRITIPEGVISVKPMPKAGWTLETVTGPYEHTYEYHGPRSEGVKEIIWTGELLDSHFDEFIFRGYISDKFAAGETLYFPTVQECADGSHEWVNVPVDDEDSHDIDHPAPRLNLIEATSVHH